MVVTCTAKSVNCFLGVREEDVADFSLGLFAEQTRNGVLPRRGGEAIGMPQKRLVEERELVRSSYLGDPSCRCQVQA